MKRNILVLILIICACFAYGQDSTPADVILILNTSSNMSSSYENVNNYITGPFLSEFVRTGDTFHLIAFSESPRLDLARRVSARGDVETIIGRMLIQYPVESGNNAGAAISFTEQYILTLPQRPKKIVLVSTDSANLGDLVSAARGRLSSSNTTIDYIQVTPGQALSNLPSSGRSGGTGTTPASGSAGQTSTTGAAGTTSSTTTPGTSQTTTTTTSPDPARQTTTTTTTDTGTTPSAGGQTGTTQTSSEGSSAAGTTEQGQQASEPAQQTQTSESSGTSARSETQSTRESTGGSGSGISPLAIGLIGGLLLLGLIIFIASRRRGGGGSSDTFSPPPRGGGAIDDKDDVARFKDHSKDLAQYASVQSRQRSTPYSAKAADAKPVVINPSGPLLLNLFVEDQNTAIGKRNIHSLKSGYSLTIGGGKSDFLVFLVPMPANIGEIRRNGSQCTFIPRKPKYFPDLGSSELRDCINKTIRVVSDKKYELRLRFEMYEDPLVALNKVLMSIKVPG